MKLKLHHEKLKVVTNQQQAQLKDQQQKHINTIMYIQKQVRNVSAANNVIADMCVRAKDIICVQSVIKRILVNKMTQEGTHTFIKNEQSDLKYEQYVLIYIEHKNSNLPIKWLKSFSRILLIICEVEILTSLTLFRFNKINNIKQTSQLNQSSTAYLLKQLFNQSLQFVQNGKILNPYILEKYGIFDLLKQVTIRELLGLTECSENLNGQTEDYMFIIPGTDISMKVTQQFMFYIRMFRYMHFFTQIQSQTVSTERMCIFSHFNQMRLCTINQFSPNVEVFDQTQLKYQQFEFANKHWLVSHPEDEFQSTCYESWLFQSTQSEAKDIFTNSYEFSESSISYSMYNTYQGQVILSPISEPYSYSPYFYILNNVDKNIQERNTYYKDSIMEVEFLYIDSSGFIISSTQQQSKGKHSKIINEFDDFDSQLCQQSKQSQVLIDALFIAGLIKMSYSISSGHVCTRYELQLNITTSSFIINNTEFYIQKQIETTHYFMVTTDNAEDMKIFSKRNDPLCFSSMQKYNEYLQKYFVDNKFKFQTSGKNYSITDDYNLTYNNKYEEFKILSKQQCIHQTSFNRKIIQIFIFILVIAFVQYNSQWL
ncbi:Conserved_hypothetical protein [Hexamita inflata]|uniref:Uncharacterized protein n=1 Tax=Hexamita inflata TaxID=28002 RepID=A0AA86PLR0_9EUKA|nr:Conserved hypothetical protein [Hexamita inflata]